MFMYVAKKYKCLENIMSIIYMVICCMCKSKLNYKELYLSFEKFLYCKQCFVVYYQNFIKSDLRDNSNHDAYLSEAIENNKISEYDLSLRCTMSKLSFDKNYLDAPVLLYADKVKKYYKVYLDLNSNDFYKSGLQELSKKYEESSALNDPYKFQLLWHSHELNLILRVADHSSIQTCLKDDFFLLIALLNFELGENSQALEFLDKLTSDPLFQLEKYYLILKYIGFEHFKSLQSESLNQNIQSIQYLECGNMSNTRMIVKISVNFQSPIPYQSNDPYSPHHPYSLYSLEIELFRLFLFQKESPTYLHTLLNLKKLFKATNSQYLTRVKIQEYISDYHKERGDSKSSILHLQKGIVILLEKNFENSYICMEYYLKLSELQMNFKDDQYINNIYRVLKTSIANNYTNFIIKSLEMLKNHFLSKNRLENFSLIDSKINLIQNRPKSFTATAAIKNN